MNNSAASSAPYLSVVAASRNDDHGGDPLRRTQIFINCFARQCERYKLPAELILVDWNPVPGRVGLAGVLQLPSEASYCKARIITVPIELHQGFKYSDRISFFQMIAKNVGIRRAKGEFILATNIDIIFSDELMRYISRRQLDPRKMLRVDRYDIESNLSEKLTLDETLDYAWTHPVRSNRRLGYKALVEHLYGKEPFKRHCGPDVEVCGKMEGVAVISEDGFWSVRPKREIHIENLHTNACGDFTLLSRAGWETIRGYAEFASYSFHIDSFGLAAAHYAGFEELALLPPCVCFHIEHSLGSGWTPEGEKHLFNRLQQKEILNPEWDVLSPLMENMRLGKGPVAVNNDAWGLANFELPDEALLPGEMVAGALHPRPYPTSLSQISALLLEFDLDRLTLWQERRTHATVMKKTIDYAAERLTAIEDMQQQLEEHGLLRHAAEGRVAELEQALKGTQKYLATVETDSAARLKAIELMQQQLTEHGLHRHKAESRLAELEPALKGTTDYLMLVEADRAARLTVIHDLQRQLDEQNRGRQAIEARLLELEEALKTGREALK
jgi:hypothetical protein